MAKRVPRPLRPVPRVAGLIRTMKDNVADGEAALSRGDCGEAANHLAHAYWNYGEAEGYTRALREQKGRKGAGGFHLDKRLPALGRLRIKVRRVCQCNHTAVDPFGRPLRG